MSKFPEIVFDISQTASNRAGCANVAYTLAKKNSESQINEKIKYYTHFGDFYFDNSFQQKFKKNFENRKKMKFSNHFLKKENVNYFWQSEGLIDRLQFPKIIHSNNFYCTPKKLKTNFIYTLHDISFLEYPDCTTEENRIGCFEGLNNAFKNSDYILSVSNFSKKEFLKYYPTYDEKKIKIMHLFSKFEDIEEDHFIKPNLKIEKKKFFLTVSTIEPRKNFKMLINAYKKYVENTHEALPLIIVGQKGWKYDEIFELLKKLNLDQKLIIPGFVKDNELAWLYKNATACLHPSTYEGFGLPLLESMSFGGLNVCSDIEIFKEVSSDSSIFLNPHDFNLWYKVIKKISDELNFREDLRKKAIKLSKNFSSKISSEIVINLYNDILNRS